MSDGPTASTSSEEPEYDGGYDSGSASSSGEASWAGHERIFFDPSSGSMGRKDHTPPDPIPDPPRKSVLDGPPEMAPPLPPSRLGEGVDPPPGEPIAADPVEAPREDSTSGGGGEYPDPAELPEEAGGYESSHEDDLESGTRPVGDGLSGEESSGTYQISVGSAGHRRSRAGWQFYKN